MIKSMIGTTVAPVTPAGKNAVCGIELLTSAALMAMIVNVTTGGLTTRAQAVQAIADLTAWLAYMRDGLDTTQAAFSGSRIDLQYFSQSQAYADSMRAVAIAQAYLQTMLFDLKAAKTYTLQTGRSTLEVAMAEYGVPGKTWDDALYDKFLATNGLHGSQILWLPAGTRVTVYL
jgi:hypothetical protein